MSTVGHARGVSRAFRARSIAQQAFPELAELLVQLRIFQFAQAFARDHHDIPASQGFLVMAERFADQAFEAIALDGELDVLLADHQAQAGVIETVLARQQQDVLAGDLAGRRVEDCAELPGCQ